MNSEELWRLRQRQVDLAIKSMLEGSVVSLVVSVVAGVFLWVVLKVYQKKSGNIVYGLMGKILMCSYSLFLLMRTVLLRSEMERKTFDFIPFDTPGGVNLIITYAIANTVVFVPLGFFYSMATRKKNCVMYGMMIGFLTSAMIELLQFLFCRGEGQMEDIIMNTLGTLIGCIIYKIVREKRFNEFY